MFDPTSGILRVRIRGHAGECGAVAFAPDSSTFATSWHDRSVVIRDPDAAKLIRILTGHGEWVEAVAYSPDGRTIVSGDASGTLIYWQASTGFHLARLDHGHTGRILAAAFMPDGLTLITQAFPVNFKGFSYTWDGRELSE